MNAVNQPVRSEGNMSKLWRKPLDVDKLQIPHGEIHLYVEQCKGCGFCVEYCPRQVLVQSTEFNSKGYHPPMVDKPDECINCRLCEAICPEFAIFCLPDTEEKGGTGHGQD